MKLNRSTKLTLLVIPGVMAQLQGQATTSLDRFNNPQSSETISHSSEPVMLPKESAFTTDSEFDYKTPSDGKLHAENKSHEEPIEVKSLASELVSYSTTVNMPDPALSTLSLTAPTVIKAFAAIESPIMKIAPLVFCMCASYGFIFTLKTDYLWVVVLESVVFVLATIYSTFKSIKAGQIKWSGQSRPNDNEESSA